MKLNYKFNENHIWTEERIRGELQRLDGITGLNGAELPIEFSYKSSALGMFYSDARGGQNKFEFSRVYLEDPYLPEEVALDTIRHEYAHYADWIIYRNIGHGPTWKKCCGDINTPAIRLYKPATAEHYRNMHRRSEERTRTCSAYTEGMTVVHEKYGTGTIRSVRDVKEDRMLEVVFEDGSIRTLSARWLHDRKTNEA